ncbi:MAG TPA: hypothetical protein VFW87_14795 [Pirellulales bacterium]|nr:hypothetical protein [Pirellulales bacterium]
MSDIDSSSPLNRRGFARQMIGGAIAAPLAASAAIGDARAAGTADKRSKVAGPDPQREEDLYLALVSRLDADRLQPEHLQEIRKEIGAHLARSKRLSDFPLMNADEPAPVYSAYRAEG